MLLCAFICSSSTSLEQQLWSQEKSPASARDAEFSASDPGVIHLHRAESTQVSMVWHNQLPEDMVVNINTTTSLDGVDISGLPLSGIEMNEGALGQLLFTLTPDIDAQLGIQTLGLSWFKSGELIPFYNNDINISVDLSSNLTWGSTGSTFNVNPDTPFSFALNISNTGSYPDTPLIRLNGDVGWHMEWDLGAEPWNGTDMQLESGGLGWVNISVWVPPVINGSPVAGIEKSWTLSATSSLDSKVSLYTFTIVPKVFHNTSIDWFEDDLVVEPSGTGKLQLGLRNVGNSQTRIEVEITPLEANGVEIQDGQANDILGIDDWTIRIATEYNVSLVGVNESGVVDINFQAPYKASGTVTIKVAVYSPAAPGRVDSVELSAEILRQRSGNLDFTGFECRSLDPGQSCEGAMQVTNNGNFDDEYILFPVYPGWVNISHQSSELALSKGGSQNISNIIITAHEGVPAFSEDDVVWKLRLKWNNTVLDTLRINITVALKSNWVFEEVIDEIDAGGNMTLSCTVKNQGNGIDGLIVVLTVSHYTEHGLIPPDYAEFEWKAEPLRDFQVLDIEPGQNMTFRSWAHLPDDEQLNGTLWMNVSMWSFSDPGGDEVFATANHSWLGVAWQPDQEKKEEGAWLDLEPLLSSIEEVWSRHSYTLFAIIFSALAIHLTMKRRNRMISEDRERKALMTNNEKKEESFVDVSAKFEERSSQEVDLPDSPRIDAEQFVAAFNLTSGPRKKSAAEPMEPELVDAASIVLDHHDEKQTLTQMDDLVSGLMQGGSKPHESNVSLSEVEVVPDRTIRHDPRGLMENKGVPLPNKSDDEDVDDLNLNLDLDLGEDESKSVGREETPQDDHDLDLED